MSGLTGRIIIRGVTEDGRKFRPSDWAERITTAVGKVGAGRRIEFHPKVSMITIEGISCVLVDKSLEQDEPMVFAFLMNFAKSNRLQIEDFHQG